MNDTPSSGSEFGMQDAISLIMVQQEYIKKLEKYNKLAHDALDKVLLDSDHQAHYGIIIKEKDLIKLCVKNSNSTEMIDQYGYNYTVFNIKDLYPDVDISFHTEIWDVDWFAGTEIWDVDWLCHYSSYIKVGTADIGWLCCKSEYTLKPTNLSELSELYERLLNEGRISPDSIGLLTEDCDCLYITRGIRIRI
jgi:hypothetical protein